MNVEDILALLQACWCERLATSLGGAPAQCCVSVGPPAFIECCGGIAWVRLVSAYPTTSFPSHTNQPQNCQLDTWAIVVEVGVTRCAPEPCDDGSNICCTANAAASDILNSDFKAMRGLFSCGCLNMNPKDIVVGSWSVYGPDGGCVGSRMTATLLTSGNCDCA